MLLRHKNAEGHKKEFYTLLLHLPISHHTVLPNMNKDIINYVKNKLSTDSNWASRAIVKLYELQTSDEQNSQSTKENNGVGFNGTDATILSSFAQQINHGRTLSPKQLAIAFKKLPKYNRQIINLIPANKLAELETKTTTTTT